MLVNEVEKREIVVNPFLIFRPLAEIREAVTINPGGTFLPASDLERAKIPTGGGTAWTVQGIAYSKAVFTLGGRLAPEQAECAKQYAAIVERILSTTPPMPLAHEAAEAPSGEVV